MAAKTRKVSEALVKVTGRGVISLPKQMRGKTGFFEAVQRDDGVIELHPKLVVDQTQSWFWTDRWQKMEREAQADIDAGRVRRYDNDEEMFGDLDEHRLSHHAKARR